MTIEPTKEPVGPAPTTASMVPPPPSPAPPSIPGVNKRESKVIKANPETTKAAMLLNKRATSAPSGQNPTPKMEPAPEAMEMETTRAASETRAVAKAMSRRQEPSMPPATKARAQNRQLPNK